MTLAINASARATLAFSLTLAAACTGLAGHGMAASCSDEVERFAQSYQLPTSPAEPAGSGTSVQAPMTNESRGVASGPDTTNDSGGAPPPPVTQRTGPNITLGAADRAKVEGILADARAADGQGRSGECLQKLDTARRMVRPPG